MRALVRAGDAIGRHFERLAARILLHRLNRDITVDMETRGGRFKNHDELVIEAWLWHVHGDTDVASIIAKGLREDYEPPKERNPLARNPWTR